MEQGLYQAGGKVYSCIGLLSSGLFPGQTPPTLGKASGSAQTFNIYILPFLICLNLQYIHIAFRDLPKASIYAYWVSSY